MNNRELEYVKTVADEKSISKAAKKLFIAQPSLSQSLQRIEESLGTKLFTRTSSGLTLTYAGERYYQIASQILKIYKDFEIEISDINDLKTGRINVGITNHLGTLILPTILPILKKNCPNIEIFFYEDTTEKIENKLMLGDLDFAIFHAPKIATNPLLENEILTKDPFVIAIAKDHPLISKAKTKDNYLYPVLDVKLLANEPLIMMHKDQRIRHISDAILRKAGIVNPNIILTLKNYETAQALAGEGYGITFVPTDYASITKMASPPVLLSIDDKYNPAWNLCITTLKNGFLSKADTYFISLVREYFAKSNYK